MGNDIFNGAKKLGFGLMRLPLLDKSDEGSIDIEQMKTMVDEYLANGFTYFDTAWMYCGFKSEPATKTALVDRYPRDSFTLATKMHVGFIKTAEECETYFNAQLEKTGAGYFDYYLLHDINTRSLKKFNSLGAFDFVNEKKAKGLIKHIGFSFHDSAALLEEFLNEHPGEFEFVQLQFNYLDYNNPGIQSKACYDVATAHGVPVIVMEPVKGGTLVNLSDEAKAKFTSFNPGASIASWAVRFAASFDNVKMVLSGMSSIEQMKDNISYMKDFRPITPEEQKVIDEVVEVINGENSIPCTGCAYCTSGCPQNIAIPQFFALYNAERKENPNRDHAWTSQESYYVMYSRNFAKASACIECGQCEEICPQHLPVIEHLKTVADYFEPKK
ncbi:MAG: aldo/keto reductase [Clostridia bacterium]|nr:aldo/keto reductase [Clostridia bacterium]